MTLVWPELLPEVLETFCVGKSSHNKGGTIFEDDQVEKDVVSGSWTTMNKRGFVSKKFHIRRLFGCPHERVERTPLAILQQTKSLEIFDHPVVKLIVSLKWSLFGARNHMRVRMIFFLLKLSFFLC